ncbi:MAG: Spy/CpxP family protein refolding chaperone [Candidatus Aminicenantes bacterium]|nr:Spy/CpxP family protein refolding chaperone [Candidatus Aminicenantes bacterium]
MKANKWLAKPAVALFVLILLPVSGRGQVQDRPGKFEEFLNLTPEQKAKLDELRKTGADERKARLEKMGRLRVDLREAMKDPEANVDRINGLIDEISKFRADRMKNGLARHLEMKGIFTPEQREKLTKLRRRSDTRRAARFFLGARGTDRPGFNRRPLRPFQDFARRRPLMFPRFWRW